MTVERGLTEQVTGGHARDVQGGYAGMVRGGYGDIISGGETRTIQDGGRSVTVTGGNTLSVTGESTHTATGNVTLDGGQNVVLRAAQKVIVNAPMGISQMSKQDVEVGTALDSAWDLLVKSVTGIEFRSVLMSMSVKQMDISSTRLSLSEVGLSIEAKVAEIKLCETIDLTRAVLKIIN